MDFAVQAPTNRIIIPAFIWYGKDRYRIYNFDLYGFNYVMFDIYLN